MFAQVARREAYSTFTFDQSHSSSSATIIGSAVMAPCPISLCGERMRMLPSGSMARKALISFGALSVPQACGPMLAASARPGNATLMARPPAAALEATTNWRRLMMLTIVHDRSPHVFIMRRGAMDRAPDADISAAAADIGEIGVDVGVARLRMLLEERRRRHDLPGLAVAALRHVLGEPGLPAPDACCRRDRPSMVVTVLPPTSPTWMPHERTASPLTCTVQAPHCAMPQPNLVPVKPISSRMTQSSGVSGSISSEYALPLTVMVIMEPSLIPEGTATPRPPDFVGLPMLTPRAARLLITDARLYEIFAPTGGLPRIAHSQPTGNALD